MGKPTTLWIREETRNKIMKLKQELKSFKAGKSADSVLNYLLEIREKYIYERTQRMKERNQ